MAARQNSTTKSDNEGMHPRVAKMLIEEASWVDDNVHQEYLAGLFIASRSPEGVSDDGVYYARIVAGMTASQVHMHYGVYGAYAGSFTNANLKHLFNGSLEDRRKIAVVAPTESYRNLTGGGDATERQSSFSVASNGLLREGLIEDCAPPNGTLNASHTATVPSLLGAIIYHRAMGYTTQGIDSIRSDRKQLARIDPSYVFAQLDPDLPSLEDAVVMAV